VDETLAQQLVALPVGSQRGQQLPRRDPLLIEDRLLDRGQAVRHVGNLHALHAREVVHRAAGRHICAAADAVFDHQGEKRRREHLGVDAIDHAAALDHQVYEVHELGVVGLLQRLQRIELVQWRGCQANLLARERVPAAEEGQLEHAHHVEHGCIAPPQRLAGSRELHAADHRVIERVLRADAAAQLARDDHLVVEDLGHAAALADNEGSRAEEFLRAPSMDPDGEVRLRHAQVRLGPEAHVRQDVGGIAAVRQLAAQHDVEADGKAGKIAGAALAAQEHDLVEFQPEMLQPRLRLGQRQPA